eukprot:361988-Chlamydomonas_euryale.AAC.1
MHAISTHVAALPFKWHPPVVAPAWPCDRRGCSAGGSARVGMGFGNRHGSRGRSCTVLSGTGRGAAGGAWPQTPKRAWHCAAVPEAATSPLRCAARRRADCRHFQRKRSRCRQGTPGRSTRLLPADSSEGAEVGSSQEGRRSGVRVSTEEAVAEDTLCCLAELQERAIEARIARLKPRLAALQNNGASSFKRKWSEEGGGACRVAALRRPRGAGVAAWHKQS